jgi:anti-sigma factor RsiW
MTPELDEKLSALLDDELSAEETQSLREEIARRPELAERLAELAAVDAELRSLPERPVPVDLRARLGERIHADRMTPPRSAPPRRRRRWLEAAVVAAAAAVFAFVVLPRLRSDEAPPGGEVLAREEAERIPEVIVREEPEPAAEFVARAEPQPAAEFVARAEPEPPPPVIAEVEPEPLPGVIAHVEPEPDLAALADELLAPSAPLEEGIEEDDLPVIAVLDVLAELDGLEGAG